MSGGMEDTAWMNQYTVRCAICHNMITIKGEYRPNDIYICADCAEKKKEAKSHDPVNHPSHYTAHPSGVECIQITRHMTFNLGNAMKYIWRCGEKGNAIQDLEKAIWYLNDEIKRLKGEVK